ncbi:hypothetical protein [Helicobacter pylori]|uniref:hypothetical protein n=1 Tax=Helicobacter pylori TaxID=210 RepID=UPI001BB42002|nr:hypothetical protein [Helicobacter pylori]
MHLTRAINQPPTKPPSEALAKHSSGFVPSVSKKTPKTKTPKYVARHARCFYYMFLIACCFYMFYSHARMRGSGG